MHGARRDHGAPQISNHWLADRTPIAFHLRNDPSAWPLGNDIDAVIAGLPNPVRPVPRRDEARRNPLLELDRIERTQFLKTCLAAKASARLEIAPRQYRDRSDEREQCEAAAAEAWGAKRTCWRWRRR